MALTFKIVTKNFDGRVWTGIKCLVCGRTSWNHNDVKNEYCGSCHQFHSVMAQAGSPWDGLEQ